MSELREQLESEVKRIIDEPMPEIEIETKNIFDPELDSLHSPLRFTGEPFPGDPMQVIAGMMRDLKDMAPQFMPSPIVYEPPPSEHKIRIFRLNDHSDLPQIESAIEEFLNNGYRGYPITCNDFLIMDFSRRKEIEENEREQQ